MNDRYLFRAKRIDNGELIEGFLIFEKDRAFIAHKVCEVMNSYSKAGEEYGFGNFIEIDPSTICQCTGLRDKTGKMIWENDILVGYLDDMFPENSTYVTVMWYRSGFCTYESYFDNDNYDLIDKFVQDNFEVCGNIFDNPELLEQEG